MMRCDERQHADLTRVVRIILITVVALLLVLPYSVHADEPVVGDSISFLPGYVRVPKSYGTAGHGFTLSGIYGHTLAPHFSLELNVNGSIFESGRPGAADFYQRGATVDAVYRLDDHLTRFITPFALAGVGGAYDDFEPDSHDKGVFLAELGVGLISRPLFSNGLRLRLDARWVHDSNEGGHSEYRGLLGLFIPLGRVMPPPVATAPATIEIREVVREVVKEVPRQWVDSDGDGVDDAHDKCPNSPRGSRVDANGCVILEQTIELRGVTFNLNQATLTPNAEGVLDTVVRAFVGQPSLRAEIAGHTDSTGSESYNQKLSQRRAESVAAYLIAHGARPDQLSAHGYGESQLLINPEKSDSDRERNRRVELRARGQ